MPCNFLCLYGGLDLLWLALLPEAITSELIFTVHYIQWVYNHLLEPFCSCLSLPLDTKVWHFCLSCLFNALPNLICETSGDTKFIQLAAATQIKVFWDRASRKKVFPHRNHYCFSKRRHLQKTGRWPRSSFCLVNKRWASTALLTTSWSFAYSPCNKHRINNGASYKETPTVSWNPPHSLNLPYISMSFWYLHAYQFFFFFIWNVFYPKTTSGYR